MNFPWLNEEQYFEFPNPLEANEEGIVAVGANLSPGVLISAYKQGIFPWFNEGDDILWWSPDPRFVLFPEKLKISQSMRKELKKKRFHMSVDSDFKMVISNCRNSLRRGQKGTWITEDMLLSYCSLHRMGWAHSVEVKLNGQLVAGLYGIAMGSIFFGESMYTTVSNGSKVAFILLVLFLKEKGFSLIDCQDHTKHLESLGAEHISRETFYNLIEPSIKHSDNSRGNWSQIYGDFPESNAYRDLIK